MRGGKRLTTEVADGQHVVRVQNGRMGSHDLTMTVAHGQTALVRVDWNVSASSPGTDLGNALLLSETQTLNDLGTSIRDVRPTFGNPRSKREKAAYVAGVVALFIGEILMHTGHRTLSAIFLLPGIIVVIVFFFRKLLYRDPTKQ